MSETWDSEELRERWWGRKISWIGGPVYRFVRSSELFLKANHAS